MKDLVSFLLVIAIGYPAAAQLNNAAFYDIYKLEEADSNTLQLELNAFGFNKNHEYFNNIADGYTLFGYQLSPMASYQPHKNFSIAAGIFIRKDFGDPGYHLVEPLFRFTYQRDSLQLIFGNIYGGLAHRLIEPLYDFDRALVNPVENGMQIRYFGRTWWVDGWFDWQTMIYEGDPLQEEFVLGLSFERELLKNKRLQLLLPVQVLAYHKGGQIDLNPDPLETFWNSAVGLRLQRNTEGLARKWHMSVYYNYYRDYSPEKVQAFKDGEGLMVNASFTTSFDLQTMLTYWRADEFISIIGGQLYPSVSTKFKRPGFVEEHRELLILRFTHELHLYKGVYLTSRFEPYYDLGNQTFEFSHGLYINYRQPIRLLKNVLK